MRRLPSRGSGSSALTGAGIAVLTVVVATTLALAVTGRLTNGAASQASSTSTPAARSTHLDAAAFLRTYVHGGRVVRTDQGGDTVSEGQAYAMLIALGTRDRARFAQVWSWTSSHLARADGLISWRWDHGRVVDPSSASDADLDMARALVLAGTTFRDPAYTRAGRRLGAAVLDHETVRTPSGLVLVAGQWATARSPYAFNPSYVSPVATRVLGRATGDPRWGELETGSRTALQALARDGHLPPDWAEVDSHGSVRPVPGPSGQPVQYGYDAARVLVRQAESCAAADRRIAAAAATIVARDTAQHVVAVYDLAGSPQTTNASPLAAIAEAAGAAAQQQKARAQAAIRTAGDEQRRTPTYYGDAWTVIGPMLLSQPGLGGCPPLAAR